MNSMKVCFAGVGSIARRHIRNFHAVCKEKGISVQIDAYRRYYGTEEGVSRIYTQICDVPDDYDIIFITNPTEMHLASLEQFHDKGKHFFIEKPVVSLGQLEKARSFPIREDSVYYVAAPLRYNAVIQWIRQNVSSDDVISVRSISSSYLPDWRPGQDYRKTYSAHRDLGGGVSIDLIHEWDYLSYLYGFPQKMYAMIGRKSGLEIDSDDYAIYLAEYKNKIIELHLDYFGRHTIREIQLFTKDDTIIGDIANNRILFLNQGKKIDFHEQRDDYQRRELSCFLDMITGRLPVENGFMHAIDVMDLTQGRGE
ncbi:MAG: Gfo/Idh/MocA family oxidoreductase [Lachnospiraceae bacterium]|nr:Gfo/Idh/MocA family oxidoreductase [Lachnospiraceae bacterium]